MALTAGAVFDRVSSVCATAGFRRSLDPFSFDQQPSQGLDQAFYVTMALEDALGYIGGSGQGEIHGVDVWVTRKIKRDPTGAYRQVLADLEALENAVVDDGLASDYNVEARGRELPEPTQEDSFVVGRLSVTVDFDRAL